MTGDALTVLLNAHDHVKEFKSSAAESGEVEQRTAKHSTQRAPSRLRRLSWNCVLDVLPLSPCCCKGFVYFSIACGVNHSQTAPPTALPGTI